MHQARVVRTALLTALTAATVAATATLSATGGAAPGTGSQPGSPSAASVYMDSTPYSPQADSVYIDAFTYRPQASMASVYIDSTVLPYAPKAAPPTTADCEAANSLACYTPDDVRSAYDLPALYARGATGKGETIMIVDAFGSPTIKADLAAFDQAFGYPAPPKLTVIAPVGAIPKFNPKNSEMVGWAGETTLDVEYAHALAPGANILLVETPAAETEGTVGFPQIVAAEEYALSHYKVAVISQSFAATEQTFTSYSQLAPLRAAYFDAQSHHVTVLAGTGDAGATNFENDGVTYYRHRVTAWPATDPLVTAVGGTQLQQDGSSVTWNDTFNQTFNKVWNGSTRPSPSGTGGGTSEFFARPSYQNGVKGTTGAWRGVPDISMSAACDGAVDVYSSYTTKGWSLACGTSEATPEFAAIVAIADQIAGRPLGLINPTLYKMYAQHAAGIVDVTSGNNTVAFYPKGGKSPVTVKGYSAGNGYDLATGIGTLDALLFAYELAGKG
jgi:subtilase family serine protease